MSSDICAVSALEFILKLFESNISLCSIGKKPKCNICQQHYNPQETHNCSKIKCDLCFSFNKREFLGTHNQSAKHSENIDEKLNKVLVMRNLQRLC